MNWSALIAWIILAFGFLLAALGTLIPGLPGAAFILIAVIVHHYLIPGIFSGWTIGILAALTLTSWSLDFFGSTLGAKLGGATKAGLLGAALGGLMGIGFGIPGLILGPFIGAVLGDLFAKRRKISELAKSGMGASLGFFISVFFRISILIAMAVVVMFALLF